MTENRIRIENPYMHKNISVLKISAPLNHVITSGLTGINRNFARIIAGTTNKIIALSKFPKHDRCEISKTTIRF